MCNIDVIIDNKIIYLAIHTGQDLVSLYVWDVIPIDTYITREWISVLLFFYLFRSFAGIIVKLAKYY